MCLLYVQYGCMYSRLCVHIKVRGECQVSYCILPSHLSQDLSLTLGFWSFRLAGSQQAPVIILSLCLLELELQAGIRCRVSYVDAGIRTLSVPHSCTVALLITEPSLQLLNSDINLLISKSNTGQLW